VDTTGLFSGDVISRVLGALVTLVVAWLIALLVSSLIRGVLRRVRLNDRVAGSTAGQQAAFDFEGIISGAAYWLIILFGLAGAFQILGFTLATAAVTAALTAILSYLPRVFGAIVLILIAWVVARILRAIVTKALTAAKVDQRFAASRGSKPAPEEEAIATPPPPDEQAAPGPSIAKALGEVVYWLTFLFFLPGIFGALGLEALVVPVQGLVDSILAFLPTLAAAALILVVGYFVARIVQRIVTQILAATGIDGLTARTGVGSSAQAVKLSDILGTIVFLLIIIPVVTAALNTLGLAAVALPLTAMMTQFLAAIPNLFAAAIILTIAYFLGRIVADLIARILAGLGLDSVPVRLGLMREPVGPGTSLSGVAGWIVFVSIMVVASMEAASVIGFDLLATLLSTVLVYAVRIVLGLVLFAIGLWLAGIAYRAIIQSGMQQAGLLANVARVSVVVLSGAMALSVTGLANDIVNLAFGLILGAVAVAAALAFGLGGREVARQQLETWRAQAELNPPVAPSTSTTPPPAVPPTTPSEG